jgi:hypothetical protein
MVEPLVAKRRTVRNKSSFRPTSIGAKIPRINKREEFSDKLCLVAVIPCCDENTGLEKKADFRNRPESIFPLRRQKEQIMIIYLFFSPSRRICVSLRSEKFSSMKRIHLIIIIITLVFTLAGLSACQSKTSGDPYQHDTVNDTAPDEAAFKNEAPHTDEPIYLDDSNRLVAGNPDSSPKKSMSANSRPQENRVLNATKPADNKPGKAHSGKIYVHTWGAQGEVWGTVVMNGNSGSGAIHDAEENTYNIHVYRRGNELLGTDQNGREYVFKQ